MIAGQVLRTEGRLRRSQELFRSCAAQSCGPQPDGECEAIRRYCAARDEEVSREIPSLVIELVDDRGLPLRGASLRVDREVAEPGVAFEVDPGLHTVTASAAGRSARAEVVAQKALKEQPVRVAIDLRLVVQERPVRWFTWALGAGAAAGLAAGGSLALLASHQRDDLAGCRPTCDPARRGPLAAATYGADVALSVALVSGAAALITYFTRPSAGRTVWLSPSP